MAAARMRYRNKATGEYVEPMPAVPARPRAMASIAYEGASQAPRLARWMASSGGPNAVLDGAFGTLRARSRDARRKNGMADSAVQVLVTNIIGTGIKPQFATRDREFNRLLAEAFLEWTDEADAAGRFDFYGAQALACGATIEGGDCFTRLRTRRPEDGLSVPLQLQVLESEFCPITKNETTGNGNAIRQGIEFDLVGRRAAYHLYRQHPNDWMPGILGGDLTTVRVPASEVAHLGADPLRSRPGAIRGEPWLSRALVELHDIGELKDANLLRQKLANMFAGFIQTEVPEEAPAGTGEVFAGQEAADTNGVAVAPLEPGLVQTLGPGQTMNFNKPPEAGDTFADFMRIEYQSAAATAGVLYEQLTGDYARINDRQLRAALNEFRRRCEMWQHHLFVFQWCRPVVSRWAQYAVMSGRVTPPAGITVGEIARPRWIPQGWPYINPVQDVAAQKAEMRNLLESRKGMVSRRGGDVEALDDEIAADNERADRLGLVSDADPRKVSNTGIGQSIESAAAADAAQPSGG